MRFCKLNLLFILAAVSVGLLAEVAWAGKKSKETTTEEAKEELVIQDTGIASFDAIYAKAKELLNKLTSARTSVDDAHKNILNVLSLPEGTPLKDALADLAKKAEGKVKVTLNGNMPHLEPMDACPENVKNGIEAVNKLVDACQAAQASLLEITTEAKLLVNETAALVPNIPAEAKAAGIKATEIPALTKKVKNNNKVVAEIPVQAENLSTSIADTMKTITDAFTGK